MPMEEDYKGAFTALRRLQNTYQLKPVEISSGQLGGLNMTARDCYNAGTYVYSVVYLYIHTLCPPYVFCVDHSEFIQYLCCVIGRENFLANEWKHTLLWMQEALKKSIEDEEQAKDVDIVSVYDHLSYSEYQVN